MLFLHFPAHTSKHRSIIKTYSDENDIFNPAADRPARITGALQHNSLQLVPQLPAMQEAGIQSQFKTTATRNSFQLKGKPNYASTQPLKVLAFFQFSKLFFSTKGM